MYFEHETNHVEQLNAVISKIVGEIYQQNFTQITVVNHTIMNHYNDF